MKDVKAGPEYSCLERTRLRSDSSSVYNSIMTTPTIISFYPKFIGLDSSACDELIATFRAWLDQHGDYGRLYMMDTGKLPGQPMQSVITGVKIYDPEIATLFKLMHEI